MVFFKQTLPFGLIPTGLILMLGAAILICLPAYCGFKIIKMSRARHPDFENWIESLGLETFRFGLISRHGNIVVGGFGRSDLDRSLRQRCVANAHP